MIKYLITGNSGFLGLNIIKKLKGKVITIGLNSESDIQCDLSKELPLIKEPSDVVIHVAGLAHTIPKTKEEEKRFLDVNFKGTENLLKSLENLSFLPKQIVFISTVAVYGLDAGSMVNEDCALLGNTPYAKSKILAEKAIINWCKKNSVNTVILRPTLIAGTNAPGNLQAMKNAKKKGYFFLLGNGKARKSMVLAEDIAILISNLKGNENGIYNLTDGYHPSFKELDSLMSKQLQVRQSFNLPDLFAKPLALIGDCISMFPFSSTHYKKMSTDLTFDDTRSKKELGWNPREVLEHFIV